jgi:hypothetical protein
MKVAEECNCGVCRAHRLNPQVPEHVQEVEVRLEHESHTRVRRRAKVLAAVTLVALVVVGALEALRVLHA